MRRRTIGFMEAGLFLLRMGSIGHQGFGAPPNDLFDERLPLLGSPGQVIATNEGAGREPQEPEISGNPGGRSLWWSWVAPEGGRMSVGTLTSGIDTLLGVYIGDSISTLTLVAENDDLNDNEVGSAETFAVTAGRQYQIAVDGYDADSGKVILTWYFEPFTFRGPANDDFSRRAALTEVSGQVITTTDKATKEPLEPDHAGHPGGRSLWWSWIPANDGTATFHTNGSTEDTVLAIYRGDSLGSLAKVFSDDDGGEVLASRVDFKASRGVEYKIAVDSLGTKAGIVMLNWSFSPSCIPPLPQRPSPPDDGISVAPAVTLRWDQEALRRKVIYGNDDRKEIYEITDPAILEAWDSTVAIVRLTALEEKDDAFTLPGDPLSASLNLCPGERFRDQPNAAFCSGFLVAPDLVATAGHCVGDLFHCGHSAFVFGFRMLQAGKPVLTFPKSQVYFCQGLVGSRSTADEDDWAILQLDRPVPDHKPLPIRRTGKVVNSQPLVVIGHPLGLPAKVAGGAFVRDNQAPAFFLANLDTYSGNSGSAVFNAETLSVEGVLVSGEEDFVDNGVCLQSNRCPEGGCSGETVARSTQFAHLVPPLSTQVSYEVHFGPCNGLELLGTTIEKSWEVENLASGTTYCWEVVARNDCGVAPGPIWSFTTGGGEERRFQRGNVIPDDAINLSDAISVLDYLFLGEIFPPCLDGADSNDDGRINLTDSVYLLSYLFLSGKPPLPPFPACGEDPSVDQLSCEEEGSCQ